MYSTIYNTQYQDPVYQHESDLYGAHTGQSHAGFRDPEPTWNTGYAGRHEDQQNMQHYASTVHQEWDDLEDDGEALLRPPPPKHMQYTHSNRLTSLSTITESSYAQRSVASNNAPLDEGVVPHHDLGAKGVWAAYEDSPTLNPRRGWDDAPQEWRNQVSPGRIPNSISAESPPQRSPDHSIRSQDRDSHGTPLSTSSRSASQSTAPPSTPPEPQPYTGPKPFLPHGQCRPPARIPSDPSWIMTGGNTWARGLREKFAPPTVMSSGAGGWGDEYRRQEQHQEPIYQTPNFFSHPASHAPAPAPAPKPAPQPRPPSARPPSRSPYSPTAPSRAYQSHSSLPRPSVYPTAPIPSHSTHPMAVWLPKGAKSVPDSIHKHESQPSAPQWAGAPGYDDNDDNDLYVSASDGHRADGVQNGGDATFVDEWDRVHSMTSARLQMQEDVRASPYQQEPSQQRQQPPSFIQQENTWDSRQAVQDVWRNHHLGQPISDSQPARDSLVNHNYNQSYTSKWQQRQASDSHPIPVWRAASGTGDPQDGPVVIAPSETTWVPPDTSWDPGDQSTPHWQRRAPSNHLTHLGPLQDLRTRHRPDATIVYDAPPVDAPVKKPKKKWWKIFSK